jgi:hypothetical protein
MNYVDPVISRLSELTPLAPSEKISCRIRTAALRRLQPRRVHPIWSVAVIGSVVCYLGWALRFVCMVYGLL